MYSVRVRRNTTVVVKFKVLTAMTLKDSMFWGVTSCSLVEVYLSFRDSKLHGVTSQSKTVFYKTGKVIFMNLAFAVGDGLYHDKIQRNCL